MDGLIKTIELTYDPTARVLKDLSTGSGEIGSTIDNEAVQFIVKIVGEDGLAKKLNDEFDIWIDFAVKCELDHRVIRPIGVLKYDKDNKQFSYTVRQFILAAASRMRKLPIQLTMREKDRIDPQIIVSRNTLEFKVTRAIDSLGMAVEAVPYVMLRSNPWDWDSEIVYQKGAIVVYNSRIYKSEWDNNQGAVPRGDDGVVSPAWSEVTGGPGPFYKPILNDDDTTLSFEVVSGEAAPPYIDPMNIQGQGVDAITEDDGSRLKLFRIIKGVRQDEPFINTVIRGDSIEPVWDGTKLIIYRVRGGERIETLQAVDLKGSTGDSIIPYFVGTVLNVNRINEAGQIIDHMEVDLKGDSLDYKFENSKLTLIQVNNKGEILKETGPTDLKGDSVEPSFVGTILTLRQVDNAGHEVMRVSEDLKGDSLRANFKDTTLVVEQVDNKGTIVNSDFKNLKGDSLTAKFDDTTLIIKQVDNADKVIDTVAQNLKGDSLVPSFDDTTLIVNQVDNANNIKDTVSKDLKGDSLEAKFKGTTLTVTQKNNAGTTIATTSSNLKGDSVKGEFDGTTLRITNYDKDDKVLSSSSSNLKGDSLTAKFEDTTLVVTQVDNADKVIDTIAKNLKGDSLEPSFAGTTLVVKQVDNSGKTINTVTKDLKGDSLSAKFNESVLTIEQVNTDGTVVDTVSKNLKGDSLVPTFAGTTLVVKQVDNAGEIVKTTSADLKGTFNAEWVNNDTSLKITDNSGEKAPVYVRGDDLSAEFSDEKLLVSRYHNGTLADTKEMWVGGDKIVPTWHGTTLTIDRYLKGELVSSESMDLKGERGQPFRIEKTYPSIKAMNDDFETCGLENGALAGIVSSVDDPDNAKLFAKGETEWIFIVDMSGATGIQGPQGIQGFKGNSLSAAFTGTTLVVTEKDYNNATVNSTSSNLKGDSVKGEFEDTTLKITNYDKEGKTLSTESVDLKGDSLTAIFDGPVLTVKQVNNAGTVVDTTSKNLKGDSLTPSFTGTVLTIKQVDNAGHVVETVAKDLKGDSLVPKFDGTTLTVDQVDNANKVVSTTSANLKGDSVVPTFTGTTLTVKQVNNAGAIVSSVSSNLKGDSVKGELNGTTLKVTNYDKDNKVLSTDSVNLKGDSAVPSFNGTVLTVAQVDNTGEEVTSVSQDLKGDSLEPSFEGPVLTVKQVDSEGTEIKKVSQNLKGDSLEAAFEGTTLKVTQRDNAGTEVATSSSNLKGDSLEAIFSGSVLTVKQKNYAGTVVNETSYDLLGPRGYTGNSLVPTFEGTTLVVTEKDYAGETVSTVSSNLKGDSTRATFDGTTLNVVNYDKDEATLSTSSANLKGDSLTAKFNGTTLTVDQVDNTGKVVNTTSKDLKGDQGIQGIQGPQGERGHSVYAAFDGYDLVMSSTDPDFATLRKNVRGAKGDKGDKGQSVQGNLEGSKLTITNYGPNMEILSSMTEGLRGPRGSSIPEGGATGQYLRKLDNEDFSYYWADIQGAVTSVNGLEGDVQLSASDVGALSDETPYVSSINSTSGEVRIKTINSQELVGDGNISVQPVLYSSGNEQNIRTINSISLLGTGDIQIPIISVDGALDATSSNPVENKVIASLIPSEASASNQLADKAFVNSSISSSTASFLGTYDAVDDLSLTDTATNAQVATALLTKVSSPTLNDYVFVSFDRIDDPSSTEAYKRFKWNGTEWKYEYTLNNSSFTAVQWNAINSGINSESVAKYDSYATVKQDTLVSGENIKTVNGESLVGGGNVSVQPVLYSAGENQNIKTINSVSLLGTGDILLQAPLMPGKDYVAHSTSASKIYGTDASSSDKTYSLVSSFQSTPSNLNIPTEKLVKDGLDSKLDDGQLVTGWGESNSNATDTKIPSAKLMKDSLGSKLDKVTGAASYDRAYVVGASGSQTVVNISSSAVANTLAYRTTGGALIVGEPTADAHATTKSYVDGELSKKQVNLVGSGTGQNIKTINSKSILGSGNIDLQTPLTAGKDYQVPLASGTNIKTINSESLLGSTDILLQTPLTAGTDYQTPLTAGTDYQTPLTAGKDYQVPLASGTNIKTINGASVLGAGDIKLQTPLKSGIDYQVPLVGIGEGQNIKTINNASILGSGNIALQTPLAPNVDYQTPLKSGIDYQVPLVGIGEGQNIKTINGASVLGSGNILLQVPLTAGTDYVAHSTAASVLYGTNASKKDTTYAVSLQGTATGNRFVSSNTDTQIPTSKMVYQALQTKQDNLTIDAALSTTSTNPIQNKAISALVPTAATASNQLADKKYVADLISENSADFHGTFNVAGDGTGLTLGLTTSATTTQVVAKLNERTWENTPNNNDYCFVYYDFADDPSNINKYERYKYRETAWAYEYTLNNSSFTAAQWAAINSGATKTLIDKITTTENSLTNLTGTVNGHTTSIATIKEYTDSLPATLSGMDGKIAQNTTSITEANKSIKKNANDIVANKKLIDANKASIDTINGVLPNCIKQGDTLTKPLTVTGGDQASAGKIILNQANKGQITDSSSSTLFGFNDATTLTVGSTAYAISLRGSAGRPTYNSKNVALFEDIAAQTSASITDASKKVQQTLSSANGSYPLILSANATSDTTSSLISTTLRSTSISANPSTGTITASKFNGNVIGNVTGNCSGSSSSCTGNSATASAVKVSSESGAEPARPAAGGVQFWTGTILGQEGNWFIESFVSGAFAIQRATNIEDPSNVAVKTYTNYAAGTGSNWTYSYAVWKV